MGMEAVAVHVDLEAAILVDRTEIVVAAGDPVRRELEELGALGAGPGEPAGDARVEDEGGEDRLLHLAPLHRPPLNCVVALGNILEDVEGKGVSIAALVVAVVL